MNTTVTTSTPPTQAAAPKVAKREAESAPESRREAPVRARSTPTPQKPAQYRLVYDKELSRTFLTVVDRESGEEIIRFPPEELVRFIDKSIGRYPAGSATGLLVDRSV